MITDLQKDQIVTGFFAIRELTERDTTKEPKKKYLDLNLLDASGQINAKVWEIAEVIIGELPQRGDIVKVEAVVQEYKGSLQLKINKMRKVTDTDTYEPQTIIPSSAIPPDEMWNTLTRFSESISDKIFHAVVDSFLKKYKDKLMYYPAAKSYHHSHQAELLLHITTMLLAAEKLTTIYPCNTDLLYTGIILHDIGKLNEISADTNCLDTDYTIEGEMLGHITLGLCELEHLEGLDPERKLLLQHMILSHHQNPEWGSPKRPMFKEAELLHYLDMIDSRMYDFNKASSQTEAGSFSPKVYSIERKVYRPNLI